MLKISDLKVGDKLRCIDRGGFNSQDKMHHKIDDFVVSLIRPTSFHINGWNWMIWYYELKYFEKIE